MSERTFAQQEAMDGIEDALEDLIALENKQLSKENARLRSELEVAKEELNVERIQNDAGRLKRCREMDLAKADFNALEVRRLRSTCESLKEALEGFRSKPEEPAAGGFFHDCVYGDCTKCLTARAALAKCETK